MDMKSDNQHIVDYYNENCPTALRVNSVVAHVYDKNSIYQFVEVVLNVDTSEIYDYREFIVDFLSRFPCVGIRILGTIRAVKYITSNTSTIWSVASVSPDFNSILGQFLTCVECYTSNINKPCNPYVIEDVSYHSIDFFKKDRNVVIISKHARLLDISDIDVSKVSKVISFEDRNIWEICRTFYKTRDRNKFIDQLIEGGYEEWL